MVCYDSGGHDKILLLISEVKIRNGVSMNKLTKKVVKVFNEGKKIDKLAEEYACCKKTQRNSTTKN